MTLRNLLVLAGLVVATVWTPVIALGYGAFWLVRQFFGG